MENLTKHNLALIAKASPRRKKVRSLRESGMCWREIAELLGVSKQRAHQIGKKK